VSGLSSWTVSSALPSGGDLADGIYYIYGIATDGAGNAYSLTNTVTVDNAVPASVLITSPKNGSSVKSLQQVLGTAADNAGGSGIARVEIRLRRNSDLKWWNGSAWVAGVVSLATTGTTSWSRTTGFPSGANLPEDNYSIFAYAYDKAGNSANAGVAFKVDSTNPASVLITYPVNGGAVKALAKITGTAADNAGGSGIAQVQLRLRRNSDLMWWSGSAWQAASAFFAATGTGSWTRNGGLPTGLDLPDGTYSAYAYAYDAAGNVSSSSIGFKVDAVVPASVVINTPPNGSAQTAITSIAGSAADNAGGSGIDHVQIRIRRVSDSKDWDGAAWVASALLNAVGTTSWSLSSGFPSGANLTPGQYRIYAYAYDKAGNVKSALNTITIQ
jgi:hypothetical protein